MSRQNINTTIHRQWIHNFMQVQTFSYARNMQQNFQPIIQSNIPKNNITSQITGVPPQLAIDL